MYSDKDIYLMDDPISALDSTVRQRIMKNLIMGHLKFKTRILVTHAIEFVHLADRIVIMDKGKIQAMGSYDQLIQQSNAIFSNLLKLHNANESTMVGGGSDSIIELETSRLSVSRRIQINTSFSSSSFIGSQMDSDEVELQFS